MFSKQRLIDFEQDIANCFNEGQIRAPVHLYSNNEDQLIKIFKKVKKQDWVFCSWRSHYQCLLKGVPPKLVKQKILEGKSITLCFPEYKIFSSAIVGGVLPIAVGVAIAAKREKKNEKTYVFMGEMTSETGIAHECMKYARNQKLNMHWVIEDNEKSVCTPTRETWGQKKLTYENKADPNITYYKYDLKWPHAGAGERVQF
jgi:TPP-dependent pyruvate/acetoin dehydrogenase alpha subunit